MNPRLTLLLLVLLGALALVVYGLKPAAEGDAFPTPAPQPTITGIKSDQVKQLTVEADGKTTVVRKTEDGKWVLQPGDQAADNVRITTVVGRLATLRASSEVADPGSDLAAFGLTQPSVTATLELDDGNKIVLQVGAATPTGTGYYLRTEGANDIFVVPSITVDDLKRMTSNPPLPQPTPTPRPTLQATPAPLAPTPTPAP